MLTVRILSRNGFQFEWYIAGYTAITLTAGAYHTCILRNDYSVVCWGDNGYGELGIGSTVAIGTSSVQMGNSLKSVNLGTGANFLSQMLRLLSPLIIMLLFVSWHDFDPRARSMRNDSNVVCWGENSDGQLGIGSTVSATGGSASTIGNNFQVVNLGTGAQSPSFLQFQQST